MPRSVQPDRGGGLGSLVGAGAALAGRSLSRRPGANFALVSFAVLTVWVSTNALFGQSRSHPNPMVATRDGGASATPDEATRVAMPVPLVREVQTALAETGHYTAAIDGRPGPATTAAIRAFQSEHGLAVTGSASSTVLSQIRQTAGEAPSPSSRSLAVASIEGAIASAGTDEIRTDATERPAPPEPGTIEAALALDADRPADVTPTRNPASTAVAPQVDRAMVKRIQAGLASAQVADLTADGIPGENTRAAIRAFQALEGMEVTGRPDKTVLDRLITIGALQD